MIMITDVINNGSQESSGKKRWCEIYNSPKKFKTKCRRFN